MRQAVGKPEEALGSLKSLEWLLGHFLPKAEARKLLTPLVGIYELRLSDAHLPPSEVAEAFSMAGIDRGLALIDQGKAMISSAAMAFEAIRTALRSNAQS